MARLLSQIEKKYIEYRLIWVLHGFIIMAIKYHNYGTIFEAWDDCTPILQPFRSHYRGRRARMRDALTANVSKSVE